MKRFITLFLTVLFIFLLAFPALATSVYSEKTEDILVSYLNSKGLQTIQELADSFADNVASGEEWFVFALRKLYGDQINFKKYSEALSLYVKEKNPSVATTKQLISLSFLAIGENNEYISDTLQNSIGNNGLMSYVFGLHLYNNLKSDSTAEDRIIDELSNKQLPDGGWAVIGNNGDPDVTAMTIQALAPYYHHNIVATESIDRALSLLSKQQLENGGYISMGKENPESPAQVLIALSSLGIDACENDAFIKNGNTLFDAIEDFYTSDHLYAHTSEGVSNDTATRQVFLGYASYLLLIKQTQPLFCFTNSCEPVLSTDKMMDRLDSNSVTLWNKCFSGKTLILAILLVIAIISCLLLFLKGKRSYKSYLIVIGFALIVCVLVLKIDISKPEDYYGTVSEISGNAISTTISIRCDSVEGEREYIPEDGIILYEYQILLPEKASVYDQLVEACKQNAIHLESKTNGYVSGMNYLYEFDFGELSGWLFKLNDQFSGIGSSEVTLSEGDHVEWVYTLNLGKDVGDVPAED